MTKRPTGGEVVAVIDLPKKLGILTFCGDMTNILGMTDILQLGPEISGKRQALKLTQTELAGKARLSRATLDALENQRIGEIGFSKLIRVLAALGLELKLQEASSRRPTLEDLMEEEAADDQGLDRRG